MTRIIYLHSLELLQSYHLIDSRVTLKTKLSNRFFVKALKVLQSKKKTPNLVL